MKTSYRINKAGVENEMIVVEADILADDKVVRSVKRGFAKDKTEKEINEELKKEADLYATEQERKVKQEKIDKENDIAQATINKLIK
jgi:hypothetical protein